MKTLRIGMWIVLISFGFLFTSCSVKEEAEEIVEDVTMDKPSGEIIILKDKYMPGEEIRLAYTMESDSIKTGTLRLMSDDEGAAGGENNKGVGEEKNFDKNIGSLTFTAPSQPGDYEISMNTRKMDGNGMDEITSVSITVVDPEAETKNLDATMELDKETYSPGENIMVIYTAPSTWDNTAWIGIVPSIIENGNERENFKNKLSSQNLSGNSKGTLTFKAPEQPGVYDLRMHSSTTNGLEVEDTRIIVK